MRGLARSQVAVRVVTADAFARNIEQRIDHTLVAGPRTGQGQGRHAALYLAHFCGAVGNGRKVTSSYGPLFTVFFDLVLFYTRAISIPHLALDDRELYALAPHRGQPLWLL
jgi:hypothetical protein